MMSQQLKYDYKKLYIGGQLAHAEGENSRTHYCPGTDKPVANIAWAKRSDTQRALEEAEEGFRVWSNMSLVTRLDWIEKLRDTLVKNEVLLRESVMDEMGKVWEGTLEDFKSITDSLRYYAEEIQKREDIPIEDLEGTHSHYIKQQPLGVVVAFLAYNFPLLNLGFKLGPALAAGCSIIIKPSEFSPLSAYLIGELCKEINFPRGVINILCGDVQEVGVPLCESTIPSLITMIGSTETAQKLIQQSSKTSIKRYGMECGGNAPFIIFEDSDFDKALDIGYALKIGNSGQICVAANRFLVQKPIFEKYANALVKKFKAVAVGFGRENNPDMGPLANEQSVKKVKDFVDKAVAQGGKVLSGGNSLNRPGNYFEPTVIVMHDTEAKVLQEEVFGPVALLLPFETKEEALHISNAVDVGLASYVFSNNKETLEFFANKLEFGEVQLNGVKYDIYLPHGGIKNSGIGVDCSTYALDDYLIRKRVSLALE